MPGFNRSVFGRLSPAGPGVAILLVSHDINAVISFCDHAILLDGGRLVDSGAPRFIAKRYMEVLYTGKNRRRRASGGSLRRTSGAGGTCSYDGATPTAARDRRGRDGRGSRAYRDVNGSRHVTLPAPGTNHVRSSMKRAIQPYMFGTRRSRLWRWPSRTSAIDHRTPPVRQVLQDYAAGCGHSEVHDLASGIIIRNRHGIELFGVTNKSSGSSSRILSPGRCSRSPSRFRCGWLPETTFCRSPTPARRRPVRLAASTHIISPVIDTPHLFTTSLVNLNQVSASGASSIVSFPQCHAVHGPVLRGAN